MQPCIHQQLQYNLLTLIKLLAVTTNLTAYHDMWTRWRCCYGFTGNMMMMMWTRDSHLCNAGGLRVATILATSLCETPNHHCTYVKGVDTNHKVLHDQIHRTCLTSQRPVQPKAQYNCNHTDKTLPNLCTLSSLQPESPVHSAPNKSANAPIIEQVMRLHTIESWYFAPLPPTSQME
jgi:hypothetical protein